MNNLMVINNTGVVVDSRQIAEWTGKEHKNILRDIDKEIEELGEKGKLIFEPTYYNDSQGRSQRCYTMNRDGVMQLALKYDAVVRYKVIQKLNELEMPKQLPQNYLDALKALVASEEEKARIEAEREEAIRTKAWISDKKTASAMGKLGVVVKENKKLKDKLGEGERQATIIAMEKKHNRKFNWRELRDYCIANEIEVSKVPDSRYGEVNAYPMQAWYEVYGIK